jgi:hypothetical protein
LGAPNPLQWLAWAGFGSFLVWLIWTRYRPEVLRSDAAPVESAAPQSVAKGAAAPAAWLYCEDGARLDLRVRWFAVRPGGRTVIGRLPRAATDREQFLYLTAEDLLEDHAVVQYRPDAKRYVVEALAEGAVLHNNEPLAPGEAAELADGDTLDLGRLSRFRFTLTGPEA